MEIQPPIIEKDDFWKGVMLGTIAGMIFAAYTYVLVDHGLTNLKESKSLPAETPSRPAQEAVA
jgi:hypothetical protein